ncbi:nitroreductase [Seohaeicola saemankumensis]|uniref:nitroreductase n=1 Tax=Seohaeicola saemankumensis TaxID=481181 RepID=UPI001E46959B|nr:nitroreductase [Seohaeicola saemankumensis]MCD1625537.1 nitroreductase [Seohaeicola saemankumensis]
MTNTAAATLDTLLLDRHSCRAFLPDSLPDTLIEEIVTSAARVPSWCNAQPWQVVVTRAPETDRFRDALYQAATSTPPKPDLEWPRQYTGVYRDRRRICGFQLYDSLGIPKEDRAATQAQMLENFRLFGAPHVAIVTTEADLGPYGAMDTGGFVALFTLAAQARGVASIPQAAVAAQAPFLRDWFAIPEHRHILCAISFGYADKDHPANAFRTARAPLSELIDWRG